MCYTVPVQEREALAASQLYTMGPGMVAYTYLERLVHKVDEFAEGKELGIVTSSQVWHDEQSTL